MAAKFGDFEHLAIALIRGRSISQQVSGSVELQQIVSGIVDVEAGQFVLIVFDVADYPFHQDLPGLLTARV